ncbi:MAG: hypothetical protein WBA17_10060 [Saprospiraceae bacterium]
MRNWTALFLLLLLPAAASAQLRAVPPEAPLSLTYARPSPDLTAVAVEDHYMVPVDEPALRSNFLAPRFDASSLAFFCRIELKIDRAVGMPFRFRLGSVDYVDRLEGKRR